MTKAYSLDLRRRRAAAARFEVSVAFVVKLEAAFSQHRQLCANPTRERFRLHDFLAHRIWIDADDPRRNALTTAYFQEPRAAAVSKFSHCGRALREYCVVNFPRDLHFHKQFYLGFLVAW